MRFGTKTVPAFMCNQWLRHGSTTRVAIDELILPLR
jgi:hypothetical protein